jgi:Reverse transcriptase (RNA-dependent DNA polymerase)
MPWLQSVYRRHHSTETALLCVLSDFYAAADGQRITLLGLLDLSAAFDCVDHDILVRRLQLSYGIGGSALAWISSFLSGRAQQVSYNGHLSAISSLIFGVPQGSSCGPLLYLLYSAEMFDVIADCGLAGHSYADDTQIYVTDAPVVMQRFAVCIEGIEQ